MKYVVLGKSFVSWNPGILVCEAETVPSTSKQVESVSFRAGQCEGRAEEVGEQGCEELWGTFGLKAYESHFLTNGIPG